MLEQSMFPVTATEHKPISHVRRSQGKQRRDVLGERGLVYCMLKGN